MSVAVLCFWVKCAAAGCARHTCLHAPQQMLKLLLSCQKSYADMKAQSICTALSQLEAALAFINLSIWSEGHPSNAERRSNILWWSALGNRWRNSIFLGDNQCVNETSHQNCRIRSVTTSSSMCWSWGM